MWNDEMSNCIHKVTRKPSRPMSCENRIPIHSTFSRNLLPSKICGVYDIAWLIEGSSAMIGPQFSQLTSVIINFTAYLDMNQSQTRQGFIEFSGSLAGFSNFSTIDRTLLLENPAASSSTEFSAIVENLVPVGGSTNTSGALQWATEYFFSPSNFRSFAQRVLVLATISQPSNEFGFVTPQSLTENAASALKVLDDVTIILVQLSNSFPAGFLVNQADFIIATNYTMLKPSDLVTAFETVSTTCNTSFPTSLPTYFPTTSPVTFEPSITPSSSPSCLIDGYDIVWMIDGSASMAASPNVFQSLQRFIEAFTFSIDMGVSTNRQAYVEFSGPLGNTGYTIISFLTFNSTTSLSQSAFSSAIQNLFAPGGTTDVPGALDFVRTENST